MEYSVDRLAKLSGVSARTLRYYDQIGLLTPKRVSNGYRVYGREEVDLLQQILFYRELEVPLEEIRSILHEGSYDAAAALQAHLTAMKDKMRRIEQLIGNLEKTIVAKKGGADMSDREKFEGFKRSLVEENEQKYGDEVRRKYGKEALDASSQKLMGLTEAQYAKAEGLSREFNEALKTALQTGDPAGPLAQKACALHREWLTYFWKDYSKQAHLGLAQTYVDDPRFRQYYDGIIKGGAEFLLEAMEVYCK